MILGAVFIALDFLVGGTAGLLAGRIGDWLGRRREHPGGTAVVDGRWRSHHDYDDWYLTGGDS